MLWVSQYEDKGRELRLRMRENSIEWRGKVNKTLLDGLYKERIALTAYLGI